MHVSRHVRFHMLSDLTGKAVGGHITHHTVLRLT